MTDRDQIERRSRRRTIRRRVFAVLASILLIAGVTFRNQLFFRNFGVVDPEKVFRSKQPTGWLEGLIRTHKLASILNLRGGSPADPFYADELRLTQNYGVDFYDFLISPTRRPTRRELLVLIDLFGRCRYPLLIHCKSGSDRTGLATGLYQMVVKGSGPAEAINALTIHYGHVGLGGTQCLQEPFEEYGAWLEAHRLAHTPERFRLWVERDYASPDPSTAFRPLLPGPREAVAGKTRTAVR